MYKSILVAIDLNDEASCHKPLLSAVELARTFRARLHVLTVVREVEAILQAKAECVDRCHRLKISSKRSRRHDNVRQPRVYRGTEGRLCDD
jgi:Universal stress protein family